jgi:hypothetical protein
MFKKRIGVFELAVFLLLLVQVAPLSAHGDKVLPQVPDGVGADGTGIRTKFDLINLGPTSSTPITKVSVLFFKQNGTPWSVATNLGTGSSFTLNMGAFQTLRVETLAQSPQLTAGYVIIRNLEPTTVFAEDYEVGITAYYEVSKGGKVIDTVSIPVAQPTVAFTHPVQMDSAQSLLTGFAVVNLADTANTVKLQLWSAGNPSSTDATDGGSVELTLNPNEQKAMFFNDSQLFPNLKNFKGMVLGTTYDSTLGYSKPVAILALLQVPTQTGVQFALLTPSYADSLRRNTFVYLRQDYPLDADIPISDYFLNSDDEAPWDLIYLGDSADDTKRRLEARQGAGFAVLGTKTDAQFDNEISIETLRSLNYGATSIDLSNASPNLAANFTFAIKTNLGRYVKVRIADIITSGIYRDLALEMYIYK